MKEVFISDSVASWFINSVKEYADLTIDDVCIIDPLLTFGPIKNGPISVERKEYFFNNYPKNDCFLTFAEYWKKHEKFEANAQNLLNEKEICIWYSDFPSSMAGFYYLCFLLDGMDIKVNVIDESLYKSFFDTNEHKSFSKNELRNCMKLLTQDEIHIIANKWKMLQEENQNYRTVVNGELISEYPDYRDGLTSIQRSILQSIYEINNNSRFTKSASVIGHTLQNHELHGDFVVYSNLVRMVQDFNNPYPLLIGLGDFGDEKNNQPAAYRYTEVKLSKYGKALLKNINAASVVFHKSPRDALNIEYLPGCFPNVFCNGNNNLLSHDYENVIKMLEVYMDNPDIEEEKLIELIGIPKFADGRILLNPEVLSEIYKTEKVIIKYKYADSETVYKKKIEYVFLNKGKPELMNLKHLVAINSKHYENTTKLSGK